MVKIKSLFIGNFIKSLKAVIKSKVRSFYSDKFNNKFFTLVSNMDFRYHKNNTQISIGKDNFDKFTEKNKNRDQPFSWFVSKSLRTRSINYYVNKGLIFSGIRVAENYGIENIEFNPLDVVIDCGANLGALWIYLNSLNIEINYVGIEPGKYEFEGLDKSINFQNNTKINSQLINKALASINGYSSFFYREDADSSIIKYEGFSTEYKIQTTTLESLINDIGYKNKNIKLLKLEAEGAEPEVVIGALKILDQIEYIAADLGPERGIKQESTLKEVSNILFRNNFEIIDFKYPRICILFKNKSLNKLS